MSTISSQLIKEHFNRYAEMQIYDLFKLIFHTVFGCEHLIADPSAAEQYIMREATLNNSPALTEKLGEYSRIYLGWLGKGLSAATLAKCFALSARHTEDGNERLESGIALALRLAENGEIPLDSDTLKGEIGRWRSQGFPAIHHSDKYRDLYRPAYRVTDSKYAEILPLLCEIDRRLEKGRTVIAIDGKSASGKTTLSQTLGEIYDCTVFRMDDFFLRPEQRTRERFAEPGGNVDRERFEQEVLKPLSEGKSIEYRPFDCSTLMLCKTQTVEPKRLVIVEGSYSMHPDLAGYYDFSVYLDISDEIQQQRIIERNGSEDAEVFFSRWIPFENRYRERLEPDKRCNLIFNLDETGD